MADADFPIITKLGGRDAVVERMRAAGHRNVTRDAARMWWSRARLPGWAIQTLMTFADEDGVSYSAGDFKAPPEGKVA